MALKWDKPVIVYRQPENLEIQSPTEALHFLDGIWPEKRGYLYSLARRRCEDNLERPEMAKAARIAFHAAVSELGMFH